MKDSEAVRSLMYRHILGGGEHLVDSLARGGAWASDAAAPRADSPAKPLLSAKLASTPAKAMELKTKAAGKAKARPKPPAKAKALAQR